MPVRVSTRRSVSWAAVPSRREDGVRWGSGMSSLRGSCLRPWPSPPPRPTTCWSCPRPWRPGCRAPGRAFRAGVISRYKAQIIAAATELLDPAEARAAEAMVLDRAGSLDPGRAAVRDQPARSCRSTRRRHASGGSMRRGRRGWSGGPSRPGNAGLTGRELPPAEVLAADQRITWWARQLRKAGLDGGMDLLRARAFLDILLGIDSRPWPAPARPARQPRRNACHRSRPERVNRPGRTRAQTGPGPDGGSGPGRSPGAGAGRAAGRGDPARVRRPGQPHHPAGHPARPRRPARRDDRHRPRSTPTWPATWPPPPPAPPGPPGASPSPTTTGTPSATAAPAPHPATSRAPRETLISPAPQRP